MATKNFWLGGTSADCEDGTNYSAGTVLADGEELILQATGSNGITGDLRVSEDIDPEAIRILAPYSNNVGASAASPFKVADFTATTGTLEVDCNGGSSQGIFIDFTSCPNIVIRDTPLSQYGCYIVAGAISGVCTITGGGMITLGASVTMSSGARLIIDGINSIPNVQILNGFTMNAAASIFVGRGYLKNYAALAGVTEIVNAQGRMDHLAESSAAIATLRTWGRVNLWPTLAVTVTKAESYGTGVIDTQRATRSITFINAESHAESRFDTRPSIDIFTNSPKQYGASRIMASNVLPIAS